MACNPLLSLIKCSVPLPFITWLDLGPFPTCLHLQPVAKSPVILWSPFTIFLPASGEAGRETSKQRRWRICGPFPPECAEGFPFPSMQGRVILSHGGGMDLESGENSNEAEIMKGSNYYASFTNVLLLSGGENAKGSEPQTSAPFLLWAEMSLFRPLPQPWLFFLLSQE